MAKGCSQCKKLLARNQDLRRENRALREAAYKSAFIVEYGATLVVEPDHPISYIWVLAGGTVRGVDGRKES